MIRSTVTATALAAALLAAASVAPRDLRPSLPSAAASRSASAPAPDPNDILGRMEDAVNRLRDYSMRLVRQEYFLDDGKLEPEGQLLYKWSRPYKVYFKNVAGPNPGREVIWVRGWNDDRIRMHKGSFPDIRLNLDPHGVWATDGTHHPIDQSALPDLVNMVVANVKLATRLGEGTVRWLGTRVVDGRTCDEVELVGPRVGETHVMAQGETLWDVARRGVTSAYSILQANRTRGWTSISSVKAGNTVFVPRYYAGRLDVCVDRENGMPLRLVIWDFDGTLYERYEHRDLRIDAGLSDEDFDPKNPAYRF